MVPIHGDCDDQRQVDVFIKNYALVMANPKNTIHVGIAFAGILVGAVLSLFTGDPAVALMFSGGAMSAIGYWLGASAQRRHG